MSASALSQNPVAPDLLRGAEPPDLTGRVVDTAGILSPTTEAAITARLAALDDSTGTQVAVLTVPSLGGAVLEEVATRVFRDWALGQAGRDDGVLLLISRDDRELRIEVGYGLEGDLTDARAATIIRDEIVPRFRDGDYDAGTTAGVDAILASVAGTYTEPPPEEAPAAMVWLFGLMFIGPPLAMLGGFLRTGTAGAWGTVLAGFYGLFLGLFAAVGAFVLAEWPPLLLLAVLIPVASMMLDVWLERHPVHGPARRERRRRREIIRRAQRRGARSVTIDGVRHSVPSSSSGSSGGGGFSGGGGSSGGGGASGGW